MSGITSGFEDPDEALVGAAMESLPAAAAGGGDGQQQWVADEASPVGDDEQPDEQPDTDDDDENDWRTPRTFDERYKQSFTGLLYVGYLTDEFWVWGHRFEIKTPTQAERIQVGQVHKPFADTLTSEIAWQAAVVAAYLDKVDDQELPKPVTLDPKESALQDRYRWVTENLKQAVINQVFNKCLLLDAEVDRTLAAMGEASG